MKKFILLSILLAVSCSKKHETSQNSAIGGSTPIIAKKAYFDCDSSKCIESIVAVRSKSRFCTGVVYNDKVLVNSSCLDSLDKDFISIIDTRSNIYKISSTNVSSNNPAYSLLTTTDDISALNSNVAVLNEDDLLVTSVKLETLNGKFIQEKKDCNITLSSISALNATKINSQTLAIKDCDNLSEDSIIFQNEELVSVITNSDILNLSHSLACGDDCDNTSVDKLEFMDSYALKYLNMYKYQANLDSEELKFYKLKKEVDDNNNIILQRRLSSSLTYSRQLDFDKLYGYSIDVIFKTDKHGELINVERENMKMYFYFFVNDNFINAYKRYFKTFNFAFFNVLEVTKENKPNPSGLIDFKKPFELIQLRSILLDLYQY